MSNFLRVNVNGVVSDSNAELALRGKLRDSELSEGHYLNLLFSIQALQVVLMLGTRGAVSHELEHILQLRQKNYQMLIKHLEKSVFVDKRLES